MVLVTPPQPLALKARRKDTTLSEVTVSVVLKVIENDFVPPDGMSFAAPVDWNWTVPEHDAGLQPAGEAVPEHVQLPPPAGVVMLTSLMEQPLPLYTVQVNVLFVVPLDMAEGLTVAEYREMLPLLDAAVFEMSPPEAVA